MLLLNLKKKEMKKMPPVNLPNKLASEVFTDTEMAMMSELLLQHLSSLIDSFENHDLPAKIRYEIGKQIHVARNLQTKIAVILSMK